jgi:hypothetical protein
VIPSSIIGGQTTARCEFVGAAEGGNNRLADGAVPSLVRGDLQV